MRSPLIAPVAMRSDLSGFDLNDAVKTLRPTRRLVNSMIEEFSTPRSVNS